MTTAYRPLLELTRGGLVESVHFGAVAVADAQGRLVASCGDPHTVAFLRSTAKPFQALPLIEGGAAAAFGLTPREIALVCASHLGMDQHVEVARAMQAKAGVSEADLQCGTHPVGDAETAARLLRANLAPTPNRHNCSGKHTGMLAQARHRGLPLADYLQPEHGVQQAIAEAFAGMCGLGAAEVVVGIDGCSAPNFAVPLVNAAMAWARLADPASLPPARAAALRTIAAAMSAHPETVCGPGGFDTELMRRRPGVILAKGGAEGYQGLGIAAGDGAALGVAIKISDGNSRAVHAVALEVLRQLGALSEADVAALAVLDFAPRRPLKNWRGLTVGEARACFVLAR